jgi:hypothetical protein
MALHGRAGYPGKAGWRCDLPQVHRPSVEKDRLQAVLDP